MFCNFNYFNRVKRHVLASPCFFLGGVVHARVNKTLFSCKQTNKKKRSGRKVNYSVSSDFDSVFHSRGLSGHQMWGLQAPRVEKVNKKVVKYWDLLKWVKVSILITLLLGVFYYDPINHSSYLSVRPEIMSVKLLVFPVVI